MSEPLRPSFAQLIGKYFDGSITAPEASLLIESLESNDEIRNRFISSSLAHLFLRELSEQSNRDVVPFYMFEYLNDNEMNNAGAGLSKGISTDQSFGTNYQTTSLFPSNETVSEIPIYVGKEVHVSGKSFFSRWFSFKKKEEHKVTLEDIANWQRRSRIPFIITIVLFILLVFGMIHEGNNHLNEWDEFIASARIEETIDAVWSSDEVCWARGGEIDSGKLSLESGMVKLRFVNGAEIILEGPGEYIINDKLSAFCNRGKISAHIPEEAVGFTIRSPFGKVVDRGTEFFFEVKKEKASLGVIKGRVDYSCENGPPTSLTTGAGVVIDSSRRILDAVADKKKFIDAKHFLEMLIDYEHRRETKRQKIDQLWDTDPDLLLRFNFDECDGKHVVNMATSGKRLLSQAVIVSGTIVSGSIYEHHAIAFDSKRAEVPFNISGKYESLTLWSRIRVDRLPNHGNTLLSTGEDSRDLNAFLWQITKSGEFQFQINSQDLKSRGCYSTGKILTRNQLGTWIDLAIVINGRDKIITHYINGKPVEKSRWIDPVPLSIESARLANIKRVSASSNDRFFSGAIEDFRVFGKPLTSKQIASLSE